MLSEQALKAWDWDKGFPIVYLDDGTYPVIIVRLFGDLIPCYLFGEPKEGRVLEIVHDYQQTDGIGLRDFVAHGAVSADERPLEPRHRFPLFKNLFDFLFKRHRA